MARTRTPDARALDRIVELASRFNNDPVDVGPATPLNADDQAILAAYVAEVTSAKSGDDKPQNHSVKAQQHDLQNQ